MGGDALMSSGEGAYASLASHGFLFLLYTPLPPLVSRFEYDPFILENLEKWSSSMV
jgi:hypothetical protein